VDLELLPGSKQGAFDYVLVATLDGLKGPLASEFNSRDGQLDLDIQLNDDLSSLIGHRSVFKRFGGWCAPISRGSLSVDPTPEPSSILLFGSGLLALTGILRRRRARPPRDMST
jgi:hypothetical protein